MRYEKDASIAENGALVSFGWGASEHARVSVDESQILPLFGRKAWRSRPVALKRGTATAETILKRYNSYNVTHPTYKALAEVGKAEKSIFLCDYLRSRETQHEVHEGLNVVENWNATNDFICYGRQGELATNSREQQEIVTLSLQLLQNCLMLINTLLLERTIEREGLWERLSAEDLRALTPLFHGHINPYGQFALDLARPSFLEAA